MLVISVISFLTVIVSFFLNIGVHPGLTTQEKLELNNIANGIAQLLIISDQNSNALYDANKTVYNVTIDMFSLPPVQSCEKNNRNNIPAVVNTAQQRTTQLLIFNETTNTIYTIIMNDISLVTSELVILENALQDTGVITTYLSSNNNNTWNYTLQSITLGGYPYYYLKIPSIQQKTILNTNSTNTIVFDVPDVFNTLFSEKPIYDDQTHKIDDAPTTVRFDRRTYNESKITLISETNFHQNDILFILKDLEISF